MRLDTSRLGFGPLSCMLDRPVQVSLIRAAPADLGLGYEQECRSRVSRVVFANFHVNGFPCLALGASTYRPSPNESECTMEEPDSVIPTTCQFRHHLPSS